MLCPRCDKLRDSGLRCSCDALLCPTCYETHVCPADVKPLWPNQERGIAETLAALQAGEKALCMTSPTGGGKTRTATEIVKVVTGEWNWRALLLTNRKILTRQGTKTFDSLDVEHGIIAAGYPMDLLKRVHVASAQTLNSRIGRGAFEVPYADLVIVDECHRRDCDALLTAYAKRGTPRLGLTATPIGLSGRYTKLIVAGTNSELLKIKALVPCDVFAPSEPDMKGVKMVAGEFVHKGMVERVMQCTVFADVFGSWDAHNQWHLPTLLFAPAVPESKWFAEEFERRGIPARHIDGDTSNNEREDIFAAHEAGEIKVISSYGVLREGADLPWVRYAILVQVCGSLTTYLQIVGRILRAYRGKDRAILQDHSGSWHRHGSPNVDRIWSLDKSDKDWQKEFKLKRQNGDVREPICCPKCHGIRKTGPKCPHCGHEHQKSVRMVRTIAGELKKMVGDVIKPKIQPSNDQRNWKSCLFATANCGQTLKQARGRFHTLTGRWPPADVTPQPPFGSTDWARRAGDVYPWLLKRKQKA